MLKFAEYIWIDGSEPVQKLRSKTKVVDVKSTTYNIGGGLIRSEPRNLLEEMPEWNFDGSSTNQAAGDDSECLLTPVRVVINPLEQGGYLVLCEVMDKDGNPHKSNQRAKLRKTLDNGGEKLETWWGFEQEYCLVDNETDALLGWPPNQKHYPKPQGLFYCGVGANEVAGRDIVLKHAQACLHTGLLMCGINSEVMLGQWEFQVGYRGFKNDPEACPLTVSDHLWLSRYLLYQIGEQYNVYATLDSKPKSGDWNGSGMHTNFSDKFTREINTGSRRIESIGVVFKDNHKEHQEVYGADNRKRLTGKHETAHYDDFSMGVADRGASIRIPNKTKQDGCGYIEDRRPSASSDPYAVTDRILKSLLEI